MKNALRFLIVALVALGVCLPAWSAAPAQGQPAGSQASGTQPAANKQPPLSLKEVLQMVKKNKKDLQKVAAEVGGRGVDFDMSPDIQDKLEKAGASPEFISNLKNLGPTARAQMAAGGVGSGSVPPEESQAYQAILNELDPDRKLQLVSDFATKYPQSTLLTYAYFIAQTVAQQKGDINQILSFGEKSLALKADNFGALMMMVYYLPLPQSLQNDPNPDVKLNEAEKDGQKALEIVDKALIKNANETDEAYQKRKADCLEEIHSGLGMVHYQRAMGGLAGIDKDELAKAEGEYRQAIAASPTPNAEDYFRLGEIYAHEDKVTDALQSFTKVSDLSAENPALKNLADQRIAELKSKKQ